MFVNTSLKKFAAMFDLSFTKGFFPHAFNKPQNYDYVGDTPGLDYFDQTLWSDDSFIHWYAEWMDRNEEGEKWDFWEQMLGYCIDDVRVLMLGFEKFAREMFELTGLRPGSQNCTLASLANQIWLKKFVVRGTIGVVPKTGYAKDLQSRKAIQYLQFRNVRDFGGELQFSGSSINGEKKSTSLAKYHSPSRVGCVVLTP